MTPSIFFVEGNIGVGKSSAMAEVERMRPMWTVNDEPLGNWRDAGGENLLDLYYKDPRKNAFRFQLHILDSFVSQLAGLPDGVHLIGRSPVSATMVFARAALEMGNIEPTHFTYLEDKLADIMYSFPASVHVYLRGSPELAFERTGMRNRQEEKSVTVGYLKMLHWLHERTFRGESTAIIDDYEGRRTIQEQAHSIVGAVESRLKRE